MTFRIVTGQYETLFLTRGSFREQTVWGAATVSVDPFTERVPAVRVTRPITRSSTAFVWTRLDTVTSVIAACFSVAHAIAIAVSEQRGKALVFT